MLLFGLGLGGALLAGFGMGAAGARSRVHMAALAGALAVTLYVVTWSLADRSGERAGITLRRTDAGDPAAATREGRFTPQSWRGVYPLPRRELGLREIWRPGEYVPMSDVVPKITRAADSVHRDMQALADALGTCLVDAFHNLALFAIGGTTVWSAAAAFSGMVGRGEANLSDILLLFIYLELGAMVGIYFKTTRLPVRYLSYIAITALARLLI